MEFSDALPRRRVLRLLTMVLTTAAGGLTGCASRQGGPDSKLPPIRSLTVLPVAIPDRLTVENRGMSRGLGLFLGPLGQIAAADATRKNSARLGERIDASRADLSSRLHANLVRELEPASVVLDSYDNLQKAVKAREADDFTLLDIPADAVLDITINDIGFYSSSGMDDYTPQVYVAMGLRSPKTSDWIGDASYAYDRSPSKGYQRHFQTPVEYKFASIDALVADSTRAVRALELAMDLIAGAIVVDVKAVLSGKDIE